MKEVKQKWWSELLGYCERYKKNRSFALAMYKQKFGVWPTGLKEEAEQPSNEVFSYIVSRRIVYAQVMKKRA